MTTDWKALCAALIEEAPYESPTTCLARALLSQPEPEGPSDRIISIAMAVQECASAWEPTARLIGNVCAEDIADLCGAVLARWGRPATPTETP